MQALADPGHALHDRQVLEAFVGQFQEGLGVERGVDGGHFGGDVLQTLGVEDFFQGGRGLISSHFRFLDSRCLSDAPRYRSSRACPR
ncbi:hypothetical protein D3C87_1841590 [compost metagenome]